MRVGQRIPKRKRNLLKIASYCDIIIGFINMMIALCGKYLVLMSYDEYSLYMLIGVAGLLIGKAGVGYEEILTGREISYKRTLRYHSKMYNWAVEWGVWWYFIK